MKDLQKKKKSQDEVGLRPVYIVSYIVNVIIMSIFTRRSPIRKNKKQRQDEAGVRTMYIVLYIVNMILLSIFM